MTLAVSARRRPTGQPLALHEPKPLMLQALLVSVMLVALAAGILGTGATAMTQATADAGADLTRLLRFMAALKGVMAVVAMAAVIWRLGAPIALVRFGFYLTAGAAMGAGPGLIWGMAHVELGAILLHGGLFATILLLWFDPAVPARLDRLISKRRERQKAF